MGGMFRSGCRPRHPRARRRLPASWSMAAKSRQAQIFGISAATGAALSKTGRIKGVVTHRRHDHGNHVSSAPASWGRLIAEMVGETCLSCPVDHPAHLLRPYNEFEGTARKSLPLLAIRPSRLYARPAATRGPPRAAKSNGAITNRQSRLCHLRDILESTRHRPVAPRSATSIWSRSSSRSRRAMELTPILASSPIRGHSFNGLLQVSGRGGALLRREPEGTRPLVPASPSG